MLVEFSNFYIPPCVGKFFKICGVHIPRKCIDSRHFYPCLPYSNSPLSSCHHALGTRKLLIPPAAESGS